MGVDFDQELSLKKWWKINGETPSSPNEIIVGKEAADRFSLNSGSSLDINGKKFFVAGVLDPTGSQDDNLLFMALPVAQHVFGKQGKIGMVEVAALCKNCPISDIVTQIAEKMPTAKVTAVQQVVAGTYGYLAQFP